MYLEILGGHQFESSRHFTYRKTLRTFRGAAVTKNTLYNWVQVASAVKIAKESVAIQTGSRKDAYKIEGTS